LKSLVENLGRRKRVFRKRCGIAEVPVRRPNPAAESAAGLPRRTANARRANAAMCLTDPLEMPLIAR
jgi:hypothetical protein